MPIINQPSPAPGIRSAFGLGDINPTLFLSPANSGKVIWGVGPTMTFPTATDSLLGNGKWSAGPALVVLTMPGHWVLGALANNQLSFAGWGKKGVNAMLVQSFVNYNFSHGWYLTSSPIITANWLAASEDRWTVPLGGGFGKLFKLGKASGQYSAGSLFQRCEAAAGRRRLAAALSGAVSFPEIKIQPKYKPSRGQEDTHPIKKTSR